MQLNRFLNPTFVLWFAGTSLIGLVVLNAGYIFIFSDGIPSLTVRKDIKAIAGAMLLWAVIFVMEIRRKNVTK